MASTISPIHRQILRVRNRLFTNLLLHELSRGWVVAGAVAIGWFLVAPFLLGPAKLEASRWWTVAALASLATLVGVLRAVRVRPSPTVAALELDQRFRQAERFTTYLTLSERERATAAGLALEQDVRQRIDRLDVREQFTLHWPRRLLLLPVFASVLLVLALYYRPIVDPSADPNTRPLDQAVVNQIKQQDLEQKKKFEQQRKLNERQTEKSEQLKQLEAELERILNQSVQTPEEARERVKELTELENQIKDLRQSQSEKAESIRKQLSQLNQLDQSAAAQREQKKQQLEQQFKDGKIDEQTLKQELAKLDQQAKADTDELRKALRNGDMAKAKELVEELRRKVEQMTPEEKEQLRQKLESLKESLDRAANRTAEKEELRKQAAEGKISAETLERELKRIDDEVRQEREQQRDQLQQLAKQMDKAKRAIDNDDLDQLKQSLGEMSKDLEDLTGPQEDVDDADETLQRLADARRRRAQAIENNDGDDEGDGMNPGDDESKGDGKGKGGRGQGSGRRPLNPNAKTDSKDERQQGKFSHKGQKIYLGAGPTQGFVGGKSTVELQGEIRQAGQQASELIETQRISRAARESVRGFFQNLGGQSQPPPKRE